MVRPGGDRDRPPARARRARTIRRRQGTLSSASTRSRGRRPPRLLRARGREDEETRGGRCRRRAGLVSSSQATNSQARHPGSTSDAGPDPRSVGRRVRHRVGQRASIPRRHPRSRRTTPNPSTPGGAAWPEPLSRERLDRGSARGRAQDRHGRADRRAPAGRDAVHDDDLAGSRLVQAVREKVNWMEEEYFPRLVATTARGDQRRRPFAPRRQARGRSSSRTTSSATCARTRRSASPSSRPTRSTVARGIGATAAAAMNAGDVLLVVADAQPQGSDFPVARYLAARAGLQLHADHPHALDVHGHGDGDRAVRRPRAREGGQAQGRRAQAQDRGDRLLRSSLVRRGSAAGERAAGHGRWAHRVHLRPTART